MEVVKCMNKLLKRSGFESNGKLNPWFYFWMLTYLIALVNIIVYVNFAPVGSHGWFTGIKTIVLFLMSMALPLVFCFCWKSFHGILDVIAENESDFGIESLIKDNIRKDLILNTKQRMLEQHHFLCNASFLYLFLVNSVTITVASYRILTAKDIRNLDIETLPLPYNFYFPRNWNSLPVYICAYILLATNKYVTILNSTILYNASFNAMRSLTFHIKLIGLALKHFEKNLNAAYHEGGDQCIRDENHLKQDLISIIRCHQLVYKKVHIVRKGIQVPIFIQIYCISMVICVAVYLSAKKDEIGEKLVEALMFMMGSFLLFLLNRVGEETTSQDELLSEQLYECSWLDKPDWFKKMVMIMMARNHISIQIKPLGLFALNLKTYSTFMNAVYSYYNLLNRVKVNQLR